MADYLTYFAADPETAVGLAYLEGVADGRAFIEAVRRLTAAKPLVLLKAAPREGQRAAASHTGSLATDARVFYGLCRQTGVLRARASSTPSSGRRASRRSRSRVAGA